MSKLKKKGKSKTKERTKLIGEVEELIREYKFKLLGKKCQFCGKTGQLGLFHVLGKGAHPRLRLHGDNILISCWFPCHHNFHHNPYYARDIIFPKIAKLLGDDWEERLLELERTEPKLNLQRIKELYEEYKAKNRQLQQLDNSIVLV